MKTDSQRNLNDWHHMLALGLVMAVVSGGLVFLFLRVDFIPNPASVERGQIDNFIKVLFAIAGIFFGVLITALAYALIFFRRKRGDDTDAQPISGNAALEWTWTLIPLAIVVALGIAGAVVLDNMMSPSQGDLVVNVTASRFVWQFEYPDYRINSYALEVPVNRRIMFNIQSKDVIHSFWVQQWGPKQDAVPGMSTMLQITPTQSGQFLVQCSQLCGYGHTDMTAPVYVVSSQDFDKWVKQQQPSATPVAPAGQSVIVDLTASNIAFDKTTITVPAGAQVTINFTNKDSGVPHDFSVYTDPTATKSIFVGQIITGPNTKTYTFTAPTVPGNYFFRCDVHPTNMTGTFIVR